MAPASNPCMARAIRTVVLSVLWRIPNTPYLGYADDPREQRNGEDCKRKMFYKRTACKAPSFF